MGEIENALLRARKLADGLNDLSERLAGEVPEELDSYSDLQEVFDALENLDAASEHIVEIRSELRSALVRRVSNAIEQR